MLSFKFRIYPSKNQQRLLWTTANRLNRLYNDFLDERISVYRNTGESITYCQQSSRLTLLKQHDESLQTIHSQVLQQALKRLDATYQSFFKRGFGFPKYRSCKNFFSITYPQSGYQISEKFFITKRFGKIPMKQHRLIEGTVKQVTLTCQANQWFCVVITDHTKPNMDLSRDVGIDVGITNILATSDGDVIPNATHAKYFDKRINQLKSRRDSKCKKGSRNYKRLTNVCGKLYDAKSRKIRDFLHKLTRQLSRKYDTIFHEDLSLKHMSEGKATGLNRELRNASISKLFEFLKYKANHVFKVNPYNTSKTCHSCGRIHDMPLRIRVMKCECGYTEDRDVNAAKNVLCLGRAMLALQQA